MTVGVSAVNVANVVLNWMRGTTPATVAGLFAKLHVGDPGASGTSNASAVTTRRQLTFNAASGGSMSLASSSGSYAMTSSETISHVSVHDNSTAGNFLISAALTTPRTVVNGDTLTWNTFTIGNSPLAA